MSDRYNDGARIVPFSEANAMLRAALGPDVELPFDEYARVQLLTEEAARNMVGDFLAENEDFAALKYGEFAPDFPLCLDWARIALALLCLWAATAGLVVRPGFYRLHYTRSKDRHAINLFLLESGKVLFLEPQGLQWLDWLVDVKKLDRVRL